MDFLVGISYYVLGIYTNNDLPRLAYDALADNLNTPSLTILAGLRDGAWDIETYLKRSLLELGLSMPTETEAALNIIESYIKQIIHGDIDPEIGNSTLINIINRHLDVHKYSKVYTWDVLGIEKLEGLYYYMDDLRNPSCLFTKSREIGIVQCKKDIIFESNALLSRIEEIKKQFRKE